MTAERRAIRDRGIAALAQRREQQARQLAETERKLRAVVRAAALHDGRPKAELARQADVSRETIYQWLRS